MPVNGDFRVAAGGAEGDVPRKPVDQTEDFDEDDEFWYG